MIRVCEEKECSNPVIGRPDKRFCSVGCARENYRAKARLAASTLFDQPVRNEAIHTSSKGAAHELAVCADLLMRGYHVFRSVSPGCPCDLITMRDGILTRIEVKTLTPNFDLVTFVRSLRKNHQFDVVAIVLSTAQIIYCSPTGERIDL